MTYASLISMAFVCKDTLVGFDSLIVKDSFVGFDSFVDKDSFVGLDRFVKNSFVKDSFI